LAVFPRCSLLTYQSRYARRSRLEKQPTDLRRHHHYMRDGTLGMIRSRPLADPLGSLFNRTKCPVLSATSRIRYISLPVLR